MNPTSLRFAVCIMFFLMAMLLLPACGGGGVGGGGKEDIAEQTWDCTAENAVDPEMFEETMLMMFPTASDLEDAKKMYIYVSSAAPIEELEAARDDACGAN